MQHGCTDAIRAARVQSLARCDTLITAVTLAINAYTWGLACDHCDAKN